MDFENDNDDLTNDSQKKFIMPPLNQGYEVKKNVFIQSDAEYAKINNTINEENNINDQNSNEKIINLMSNNSTDLYKKGPRVYEVKKEKSNLPVVIVLTFILLLVLGYIIFIIYNTASRKMVCESKQGDITIIYNKKSVTGYKSSSITYNIYEQREYADEIGIENYLDEFSKWFNENTNGVCKR